MRFDFSKKEDRDFLKGRWAINWSSSTEKGLTDITILQINEFILVDNKNPYYEIYNHKPDHLGKDIYIIERIGDDVDFNLDWTLLDENYTEQDIRTFINHFIPKSQRKRG